MTAYKDVVRDFIGRTRRNLDLVREHAEAEGAHGVADEDRRAFEVTQLVNSMLGLLVFPQQKYFNAIPRTPLADLAGDGWPQVRAVEGFPDVADLREMMRYLRNAVAHFNIEFTEQFGTIDGVRVWNTKPNDVTNWKTELSMRDLESITERFCDLLDEQMRQGNGDR